jgi:hypothetical protein
MSATTIVVRFGDSVSDPGLLALVELDDSRNLGPAGEPITGNFPPGQSVFFLVHHDPLLRIGSVVATSGSVAAQGLNTFSREQQTFFQAVNEPIDLPHLPTAHPAVVWYGRQSALIRDGRSLTAPGAPCIGDLSYQFTASLYRYTPPSLDLDADEVWPVGIVITMEEI